VNRALKHHSVMACGCTNKIAPQHDRFNLVRSGAGRCPISRGHTRAASLLPDRRHPAKLTPRRRRRSW
jgi:hypothetical protein